jgi:hypothetical protein
MKFYVIVELHHRDPTKIDKIGKVSKKLTSSFSNK